MSDLPRIIDSMPFWDTSKDSMHADFFFYCSFCWKFSSTHICMTYSLFEPLLNFLLKIPAPASSPMTHVLCSFMLSSFMMFNSLITAHSVFLSSSVPTPWEGTTFQSYNNQRNKACGLFESQKYLSALHTEPKAPWNDLIYILSNSTFWRVSNTSIPLMWNNCLTKEKRNVEKNLKPCTYCNTTWTRIFHIIA